MTDTIFCKLPKQLMWKRSMWPHQAGNLTHQGSLGLSLKLNFVLG